MNNLKFRETFRKTFRMALLILTMLIAMSVPAQAASAKTTYKKAFNCYQKKQYKKANHLFKKLPVWANEKCVRNMPAKMKRTYRAVVKRCVKKYSRPGYGCFGYCLTDIDKDGKAELIIIYGRAYEAGKQADVYYLKNGRTQKAGILSAAHAGFFYYPLGNGFLETHVHMGYESVQLVTLKNGKLKKKDLGWANTSINDNYVSFPYALSTHVNGRGQISYSPFK